MINANTFYIFSGFGKVIRAIQKSTGKVVAIKSMSVEDEKMLNLILKEVDIRGKCSSRYIVDIVDSEIDINNKVAYVLVVVCIYM